MMSPPISQPDTNRQSPVLLFMAGLIIAIGLPTLLLSCSKQGTPMWEGPEQRSGDATESGLKTTPTPGTVTVKGADIEFPEGFCIEQKTFQEAVNEATKIRTTTQRCGINNPHAEDLIQQCNSEGINAYTSDDGALQELGGKVLGSMLENMPDMVVREPKEGSKDGSKKTTIKWGNVLKGVGTGLKAGIGSALDRATQERRTKYQNDLQQYRAEASSLRDCSYKVHTQIAKVCKDAANFVFDTVTTLAALPKCKEKEDESKTDDNTGQDPSNPGSPPSDPPQT